MGRTDGELAILARGGDVAAFSALVERHWARLVAFARSLGGDVDAEDEVQEALITAWDKIGGLKKPGSFRLWVTRIVARRCLRRSRSRRRLVALETIGEPSDPTSLEVTHRLDVERLIGRLAPRQRAVMHLTIVEGMTDSEIGLVMGILPASVRSHRRRARENLKAALERPMASAGMGVRV